MSCSSDPMVSRAGRQLLGLLLLVAAAIVAAGIFALILTGGAAAEEVRNGTVTVDNSTADVYVSVTFNDSVADADATANVTITAPGGTAFVDGTISGTAGNVTTREYEVAEGDPAGDYEVIIDAPAGVVDSTTVGTFDEDSGDDGSTGDSGGGGGMLEDDSSKAGVGVAIVAIAMVAIGLARRADQ